MPRPMKNAPQAFIGPTGQFNSFGIQWRGAEWLPDSKGYSGPFGTLQEAEERACDIALFYAGIPPIITRVANVNNLCRQCGAERTSVRFTVTCGASICQEREASDNARRAAPKRRKARS